MRRLGPSPAQWTIAITLAAAAHLALAAALLWETEKPGAVAAGLGGIEVSLGPEGGAPDAASETAEEAPEATNPTANTVETPPEPPPVETLAMAEPIPEPPPIPPEPVVEDIPPEPVPEPVAVPEPEPEPEPEPVIEEEIAIVEPPPEPKPEPPPVPKVVMPPAPDRPVPPKRKPVEVVQPKPQPKPVTQVATASPLPPGPAEQVTKTAPPPGSAGVGGTSKRAEVGSAASVSGGGLPGAAADYVSLLRAWLEKHKDYPRRARSRGQEGTAMLYFVMDGQGQVLEYDLRSSSGYKILDDEVRKMIERAQPLPVPPVELLQNDRREFLLPVEFGLR